MPNRETHQASTLILAGAAYAAAGQFTSSPGDRLLAISGILTGLAITPDLDLAEAFDDEASWSLYGVLFKHRGISHWPVIGTLTRVVYLAMLGAVLAGMIELSGHIPWIRWQQSRSWIQSHWPTLRAWMMSTWFVVWLAGLMAADLLHWLLDISSTKIKRWMREDQDE